MIKKKAIYSLIYFGMIFIVGMILTHNEYISTALIIDFSSKIPHTISLNIKGTTKIYYKNIDYILIRNLIRDETTGLSITLPLKYSDRYKKLVE